MSKFFDRLFKNFGLAFFLIGFGAIVSHAVIGQPYGETLFWSFVGVFTAAYQLLDYLHDWMVARRIKV